MVDFDRFIGRHSEASLQALIEGEERRLGIRPAPGSVLEDRWNVIMNGAPVEQRLAA